MTPLTYQRIRADRLRNLHQQAMGKVPHILRRLLNQGWAQAFSEHPTDLVKRGRLIENLPAYATACEYVATLDYMADTLERLTNEDVPTLVIEADLPTDVAPQLTAIANELRNEAERPDVAHQEG